MQNSTITKFFILAGISNILGVLVCSKFFTNSVMMNAQPAVMSYFGLISIILWGAAYIAVSKKFIYCRALIGVFVVEKLAYAIIWLKFITNNSVSEIYKQDPFAGIFYSIYGINDLIFMLFFSYIFIKLSKKHD